MKKLIHFFYNAIPLSDLVKLRLKLFTYHWFGFIFKEMPGYRNWTDLQERIDVLKHENVSIRRPSASPRIDETNVNSSEYTKKVRKEIDFFKKREKVHDLPDIFHYWSNKHLLPIFHDE